MNSESMSERVRDGAKRDAGHEHQQRNPIARLLNQAQEERAQWPARLKRTRGVNDDGSPMTDTQRHEAERLERAKQIIEDMSPEERRRLRGWLDMHGAPSGELYHKLYCDEYHQHTAPRCCAGDCWCRVSGVQDTKAGPIIEATEDHPAVHREGSRLVVGPHAAGKRCYDPECTYCQNYPNQHSDAAYTDD